MSARRKGRLAAAGGILWLAACAADPGTGQGTKAELSVLIESPHRGSVSYRVRCGPDGPSLQGAAGIDPSRACAALARPDVRERLIEGHDPQRACTMVYGGPERARISGTLDGRAVDATIRRNNGCGISDWDNLLSDILPDVAGSAD